MVLLNGSKNMTKIEFYSMLADWNDKERKNWLAETKHTTLDYREILFSYVHIYEKILPSDIIIKEYGYFGGVRCSNVYLLDCGAILINIHNDYMKPWNSNGIISYDKLLEFITNIDKVDEESCHIAYN